MDGVEGRDEVVLLGSVECRGILVQKTNVCQPFLLRLGRASGQPDVGNVQTDEAASGYVSAIRLTAWPEPQPMSTTSMPCCSRSTMPGTTGKMVSIRAAS